LNDSDRPAFDTELHRRFETWVKRLVVEVCEWTIVENLSLAAQEYIVATESGNQTILLLLRPFRTSRIASDVILRSAGVAATHAKGINAHRAIVVTNSTTSPFYPNFKGDVQVELWEFDQLYGHLVQAPHLLMEFRNLQRELLDSAPHSDLDEELDSKASLITAGASKSPRPTVDISSRREERLARISHSKEAKGR
jgi:hypothetical protein